MGNVGDEPLEITDLRLRGLQDFTLRLHDEDLVDPIQLFDPDLDGVPGLSPGASFEFRAYFRPQRAGLYEGALILETVALAHSGSHPRLHHPHLRGPGRAPGR